MATTWTLCASRKMLCSVCLLPIPLTFHCSMLNDLFDMVGMWTGLGGGEGGTDPAICFTIIRSVSKTITSYMYAMRTYCTQVAGILASDVFVADLAAVP